MKFEELKGLFKNKKLIIISVFAVILGLLLLGGGKTEKAATDTKEAQLEQFLESIKGVGECKVIITYKSDSSYYSKKEEVYAVAVCCRGATRKGIEAQITELVSSLYGIGTNRVKVFLLD
ncbi:MAG: hypothetical protein IIX96_01345 [Clostridia bacterium]|nr:hypothetical protein [Clostridia bacterium]